ncbi:Protein 21.1 [Giardia lamblia P15]|uniref:Protein 21.1 n=1 Tax=Giardia intestinalis (strain P15) TaxID=658858 RepID=E1F3J7_GIAIA|nr:Protein 21.1 [Giardia lamblia P15]
MEPTKSLIDTWFECAFVGDKDRMNPLVDKCAGRRNDSGETALMVATRGNQADVVSLLLQKEATLLNSNGECAMHIAVKHGYLNIVQLLIPFEGHIYTREGNTSLMLAINAENSTLCNYLLRYSTQWYDKRGFSVLAHAVSLGNHALAAMIGHEIPIPKDVLTACTEIALRRGDTAMCSTLKEVAAYQTEHVDSFFQPSNSSMSVSNSVVHTPSSNVRVIPLSPTDVIASRTRSATGSYIDATSIIKDEVDASVLSANYISKKSEYKKNEIRPMNESRHLGHPTFPPTLACTEPKKISIDEYLEYSQSISRSKAIVDRSEDSTLLAQDFDHLTISCKAPAAHEQEIQRAADVIRDAHDLVVDALVKVKASPDSYSGTTNPLDEELGLDADQPTIFTTTIKKLSAAGAILEQSTNILQQSLQLDKESVALSQAIEAYKDKTVDEMNSLICSAVEFTEEKVKIAEEYLERSSSVVADKELLDSKNVNVESVETRLIEQAKDQQYAIPYMPALISSDIQLVASSKPLAHEAGTDKSLVLANSGTNTYITPLPTTTTKRTENLREVYDSSMAKNNVEDSLLHVDPHNVLSNDPIFESIQRRSAEEYCPPNVPTTEYESHESHIDFTTQSLNGMGKELTSMILSGQFSHNTTEKHMLQAGIQRPSVNGKILESSYKRIIPEYTGNYTFTSQMVNCATGRFTELMDAVVRNDIICVKAMLPYQGRLQDENGTTALMLAAERGLDAIVCVLVNIEAGMGDIYGETALMRAAKNNRPSTCELLLGEVGLRTSEGHPNKEGLTALCFACIYGSIDCVRVLLGKEAKLRYRPTISPDALSSSAEIRHLVQLYSE